VQDLKVDVETSRKIFENTLELESTEVLTAAAEDVEQYLNDLFIRQSHRWSTLLGERERVVLLHVGADISSNVYLLEYQGRNDASFVNPDEKGWQPMRRKIYEHKDLSHTLMTSMPVEKIRRKLREKQFRVSVSTDAGSFVCNWIYYSSLHRSLTLPNVHVLFVHVPSYTVANKSEQARFLVELIKTIACTNW